MKVCVLGAKGFIGSNIVKHFKDFYEVVPVTRETLNLLDPLEVRKYLKENAFDVIIGAFSAYSENSALHDTRNNLGIFMNFFDNAHLFGKYINLGSGAEFDRNTNIDNACEDLIFKTIPSDSYGFGLNIRSRLCKLKDCFYTIRIFNCFGRGELSTRIFPRFLNRESTFTIHNDRYFDYFSIQDLLCLLKNCIENDWEIKDINAVYDQKLLISDVLRLFCNCNNLQEDFYVVSKSENNYTGSSSSLNKLHITLSGLKSGFERYL